MNFASIVGYLIFLGGIWLAFLIANVITVSFIWPRMAWALSSYRFRQICLRYTTKFNLLSEKEQIAVLQAMHMPNIRRFLTDLNQDDSYTSEQRDVLEDLYSANLEKTYTALPLYEQLPSNHLSAEFLQNMIARRQMMSSWGDFNMVKLEVEIEHVFERCQSLSKEFRTWQSIYDRKKTS